MGIRIVQGYGLTECSPIVAVSNDDGFRHDSAGKALAGMDICVENIGDDGIGEFVISGDNVMMGYYENPIATKKVLSNGCFYTGDLGYIDEESGETDVNAQIVIDVDEIKEKLNLTIISKDEIYRLIQAEVKEINKQMPLYKRVKNFTIREEEFVKTTTKKIKRYVENIG